MFWQSWYLCYSKIRLCAKLRHLKYCQNWDRLGSILVSRILLLRHVVSNIIFPALCSQLDLSCTVMVCQPCPWFGRIVLSSRFFSCSVWFLTRIITGWAFTFLLALWQKLSILVIGSCKILTSTHCKKLMMNSMGCYSSWSLPWICSCGRCLNVHVACWIFFSFSLVFRIAITLKSLYFLLLLVFSLVWKRMPQFWVFVFVFSVPCLGFPLSLWRHCHSKLQGLVVHP